jgi:hypothetical protein
MHPLIYYDYYGLFRAVLLPESLAIQVLEFGTRFLLSPFQLGDDHLGTDSKSVSYEYLQFAYSTISIKLQV